MELTEHSVWILPALELNLCLQMLGAGERQVLPVARTDTPLNHRMLNSFLYLLELGLVETEGARFRPSRRLRRRLEPVAFPVQILRLGDGKEFVLAAYLGEEAITLARLQGEDGQSCRLSAVTEEELAQELECLPERLEPEQLQLELLDREGQSLLREPLPPEPEGRREAIRSVLKKAKLPAQKEEKPAESGIGEE
jgi:hypothetical protein